MVSSQLRLVQELTYVSSSEPVTIGAFVPSALMLTYIAWYVIIPLAIGTVLARLVIHAWAWRTERQLRVSPWPLAIMSTTLLSTVYAFGLLLWYLDGDVDGENIHLALVMSAVFTAPTLLVLGPAIAIYFIGRDKPVFSDAIAYTIVAVGLVANYVWFVSIFAFG